MNLSNPTSGNGANPAVLGAASSASITVQDDDPPELTINNVSVSEENTGIVFMTFTVSLSSVSTTDVSVDWATANGTAVAGVDYEAASGTVTLPAGTIFKDITVRIIADTIDEVDETLFLNLTNITPNAQLRGDQGVGTIIDDDGPCIWLLDAQITEGDTGTKMLTFTAVLRDLNGVEVASPQDISAFYSTTDGTATNPSDYISTGGQLSWPAGTTRQFVNVPLVGDFDIEADETFTVSLSNAVHSYFCRQQATGTIINDDSPGTIQFSSASYAVAENIPGGLATITVLRIGGAGGPASVDYATSDGTAVSPADFGATSGTLNFGPGETSKTFSVSIVNDPTDEPNENLSLTLSAPTGATLGTPSAATLTINDDDAPPSLTINDVTTTEGNSGTTNAVFTVSLSVASGFTVTVDYATAAGSATSGSDFTATSGTLTIPAGSTSGTISVPIVGDTLTESNETYVVNLSNASGATISDGQGAGTITDDDPIPGISIAGTSVTEGNGGTTNMVFAVSLTNPSQQIITVNYATSNGTATAGVDYTSASGTLTIPANTTSASITVVVNGDLVAEPDETLLVTLSAPVNATISTGTATGTINDDDGTPTISITDVSAAEGNSGTTPFIFTVSLSVQSSQTVTVNYATANGSASSPSDYAATSGTLTFNPGQTSATVTVLVNGDITNESDETFVVNLSSPTNAAFGDNQGQGTILNDDSSPSLSVNDVTVTEGNSGSVNAAFTVALSPASGQTVTVNYATADGSAIAGADYTATSGSLSFAPGETSKVVNVPVLGDVLDELNETFFLNLSGAANAAIIDNQGLGTITDDDPTPSLSINDVSVPEGNSGSTPAQFTVTLSAASALTVTVSYSTAAVTATSAVDYSAASGTLTFAPGEVSKTITVGVLGDLLNEPDETWNVNLSAPANATITKATGVGTINDDDPAPTLSLNDILVGEGNSGTTNATFTVTLSAASGRTVTVNFSTADGTALAPGDYTASSGSLTFSPGETSKVITVSVIGDSVNESDETFLVNLSAPVNATILDGQGQATILNDDSAPAISIGNVTVLEGNSGTVNAVFSVTLSNASSQTVTVDYATASGTATSGSDFTAASSQLSFSPGQTNQTVTVAVTGDRVDEDNENFFVNLSNPVNATISIGQGTGTITDDDVAGFSIVPSSGLITSEAGQTAQFTVVLNSVPTADVTIVLSSSDSTEGTVAPSSLTFTPANALTAQTVTVTGVDDTLADGNIAYTIVTAPASSTDPKYAGLNPADVSVTNNDNDTPGITVAPTTGLITTESGGTAQFTIVLNTTPTADVTIALSSSDSTEGSVSASSVTFTPANALIPRTITVTGVDDAIIDGSIAYIIITAPASSTDPNYANRDASDVSVTNQDNEAQPSISINDISIAEGNTGQSAATFTVTLSAVSAQTVSVQFSTANGSATSGFDYLSSSGSLTFNPGEVSKSITVQVLGDTVDEANETFNVNLVTPVNAGIADSQGVGTIIDDDTAGYTLNPVSGLVTTEAGGVASFTIVLNSTPTANVTISLTSSDTSEGTVSPSSVTFTPGDALVARTVTITGVDDAIIDGDVSYSIVTGAAVSTDPGYSGTNPPDVSVSNSDNDSAGIIVLPTSGLITTEAGGTASFTVRLAAQPSADVTVAISSSDSSEGSVSVSSLTFTAADWSTPKTVVVTGVNDTEADGDIPYTIVLAPASSSDANFSGVNPPDVSVTNKDDDAAGIVVTPTSGLVTSEAGGTASFTVRLSSTPTSNVTINISSSDSSEGTVSQSSLTFTPANAFNPQTITVTGVDDTIIDGSVGYSIITAPAISTDPVYSGRDAADVSVSNLDNDVAGIIVTPASGLVTSEAGITATFTVRLSSTPSADVTIALSSSDTTEGTVSPASITFTPANWNQPQTVTVTGVDDTMADGNINYSVITAPASSADANFNGVNGSDVSVINNDNDSPGITVSPTSGLVTNEGGGIATFQVVLNTTPTSDVTIPLSSTDTTEGTVSPASLTFTPANALVAQIVTITGVNDNAADGDIDYQIVTGLALSSDPNYAGTDPTDVDVVNEDNDTPGITILLDQNVVTTEAGGSATFRVVLNTTPTSDVRIDLAASDANEGTVSPAFLTFTPANALIPQTVTVTGVDDQIDDGDVNYLVITAPASSADPNYSGRDAADVPARNIDDDTASVTVTPVSGLVTSESGASATFTVRLTTIPTAPVTIALSSSNPGEGTPAPASLTFTAANALTAQTVTVTGVDDAITDGDVPYSIVTMASSPDPVYEAIDVADVSVTNLDDEGAPRLLINDVTVTEGNTGTTSAVFTISLSGVSVSPVSVQYATADGSAVAGSDYVASSGSVTIAPGASSITITVPVITDAVTEPDENFAVILSNPSNATIAKAQGLGTIIDDDGVPAITSLSPSSACAGHADLLVTVSGSNFVSGSQVQWDGAPRVTTYISSTQLQVQFPAADLASARTVSITVANPSGGGTSQPVTFTVGLDSTAPVVQPPDAIDLVQTMCQDGVGGSNGVTSETIAAFLAGGSATDDCSEVTRLSPQLEGADVSNDIFIPGGVNSIDFLFKDASGNVGKASSTVTIRLYGDLNEDFVVDASDLVIMANYLVRNINIGQAPFTAPLALADLNQDQAIDAVDLVILAHYLVGNIPCLPKLEP
ncbi:MAG: Calx-beta domain-containing protein [Acidobacteriota bacterium]